jgi:hypothetical protein
VHVSVHTPVPSLEHVQFALQPSSVHAGVLPQWMVQLFPGHESVGEPEPLTSTVQPPCGHEKVQAPVPAQENVHPAP